MHIYRQTMKIKLRAAWLLGHQISEKNQAVKKLIMKNQSKKNELGLPRAGFDDFWNIENH